jgi:peroxiredoxin
MLLLGAVLLAGAVSTGPEVGAKIPDFSLPDQSGQTRNFAALKGPKGLVLVFFRSADW